MKPKKMEAGNRSESDHMPLIVEMLAESRNQLEEERSTREVINWNKEAIKRFKEKTREKEFEQTDKNEIEWEILKMETQSMMETKRIKIRKRKIGYKVWWDKECTKEKRRVNRCYKE